MRSRLVRVLLPVVLVAGVAGYVALPYARALSLIVRGAHLGGAIESFATRQAYRVTKRPVHRVPTRAGDVAAQFYVPDRAIGYPVLVIPGIHSSGIEEARLTALSTELAGSGLVVMTMALPDLQAYRITPEATDTIEDAVAWLATQREVAPDGRIGLVGISFAGGMSVSAATRDSIRDKLAYVVSFGGHGDLPRVMKYLVTGQEPVVDGIVAPPPHDYGVAVILYGLADRGVVPPEQVEALRASVETFLLASQQTVNEPAVAEVTFSRARDSEATLPEPSRTYMRYVNDRAVDKLGPVLLPYLNQLGADDPALSAGRTSTVPKVPVYLLHGTHDTVIPAVESVLLARHLEEKGARVHLLLSGLITHAEVNKDVPVREVLSLVGFWASMFRE